MPRPSLRPRALAVRHIACRFLALSATSVITAPAGFSQSRDSKDTTPVVAESPGLFTYHSTFWVNLHHMLYVQSRASLGLDINREIIRIAMRDTLGLQSLDASQRAAWNAALGYYARNLARRDVLEREMGAIKATLGDAGSNPTLSGVQLPDSLRDVLQRAAPVFRAGWFASHDVRNREWISMIHPLVAEHGSHIAREMARVFNTSWPRFLLRVDVVAYANWAGAYTTNYPDRITVSSRDTMYGGLNGLEMIFHEAMHTMDDSVRVALLSEGKRQNKTIPPDLTHAIIFYTAGEVTRRRVPTHRPYAELLGIWNRGTYQAALPLLRKHWQPWIEGQTTFPEAIRALVSALPG